MHNTNLCMVKLNVSVIFLLRLEGSVQAAQEEYDRIQKQVCRNKLYNMKKSLFI